MKVSIVTVALNSQDTIRQTIESVLRQTYSNIEYWIIDGLSEDGTVEIANEYRDRFLERGMEYHIVSEKDNGIYDAMNKGIRLASGELVGIINSDDWYEDTAVECAAGKYLEEEYDLFYADIRIVGDKKSFIKKSKDGRLVTSRYWNHPTTFVPKRVYTDCLYRNKTIHDDWDLILRIRNRNGKVCVVNQVLANFRRNGVSHEKSIKKAWDRAKIKYGIYRENGYSRWYAIECYGMEIAKMIL